MSKTETKKVVKDVIEVEEACKRMAELFDAFMKQELGNKVTQFNMQGLAQLMVATLTHKEE